MANSVLTASKKDLCAELKETIVISNGDYLLLDLTTHKYVSIGQNVNLVKQKLRELNKEFLIHKLPLN